MKYFIDTEFHEHQKPTTILGIPISKTWTIDLISIGIVAEDGREYYAINRDLDFKHAKKDKWLRDNVLSALPEKRFNGSNINVAKLWKPMKQIRTDIISFIGYPYQDIGFNESPEFYAYYADYDWVVFCWIFGRMMDLPPGFPMYCKDLKQIMDSTGLDQEWKGKMCPDPKGAHNALVDARWNKKLYEAIIAEEK